MLTVLSLALLIPSAWDSASAASKNFTLWSRMRARGRTPPDTGWDREYRALLPYLPPTGAVGFVHPLPEGTLARERQYFFLQYALSPHLVQPGITETFVVVHAPPASAEGLVDPAVLTLVHRFGDDFALYRRTDR